MSKNKKPFKQVRLRHDTYARLVKIKDSFEPKLSRENIVENALQIGFERMEQAETTYFSNDK